MNMRVIAKRCISVLLGIGMFGCSTPTGRTPPSPGNTGGDIANYMISTWPVLDDTTCGHNCFSLNYSTVPASPAPKFWEYTNGVPLYGIWMLYEKTGRQEYYDYVKKFVDTYVDASGNISYARAGSTPNEPTIQDTIQPANLLFGLYEKTGDARYLKAMANVRQVFNTIKVNPQGAFWHKPTYSNQQWLDAIYMSEPFLVRYGALYADKAIPGDSQVAFDTATHQIKLAAQYTFDPSRNLYYHAWNGAPDGVWLGLDASKGKAPPVTGSVTSPVLWSRSIAWYITGIVDVLEYLPENHPDRPALVRILENIASALKQYQDPETGLWYQVTDVMSGPLPANGGYPGESVAAQPNFLETSASALFVYSLAKSVRLGYLPGDYLHVAKKGWAGVKSRIDVGTDGAIKLHGTVVGMSVGGTYNAYTNVDTRTDLTSGDLPAPKESCSNLPTDFTSPPLVCKFVYVRDNVPQGLGAAMLAATEMEY